MSETWMCSKESTRGEFTASFQGRRYAEPCVISSHRPAKPPFRAYPTLVSQDMRWNPLIACVNCKTQKSRTYLCNCSNCKSSMCPSRIASTCLLRGNPFKSRIAQFTDQSTMTPVLNNVSCNVTPEPSRITFVETTETRRDVECSPICGQESPKQTPSILKKTIIQDYYDYRDACDNKRPVKDCEEYHEPTRTSSLKRFFSTKKRKKSKCPLCAQDTTRVPVYNEGISDSATNLPIKLRRRSKFSASPPSSGTSVKSRNYDVYEDGYIPYSYYPDSKYHSNCARPKYARPVRSDDSDVDACDVCMTALPSRESSKTGKSPKTSKKPHSTRSIPNALRMLASNHGVEVFLNTYPTRLLGPQNNGKKIQ